MTAPLHERRTARVRRASRATCALLLALLLVPTVACAPEVDAPAPAVMRTTPPPWDAPRDAVSYIDAAGLDRLPFGHPVAETTRTHLEVVVDGEPVVVPAFIGIDRVRATEAALHTHADDGVLWVESPTPGVEVTLGTLFDLWGVRLDARCLGALCAAGRDGGPVVTVDGTRHAGDPRAVVLRDGEHLVLTARR